jgi:hypothetical protein
MAKIYFFVFFSLLSFSSFAQSTIAIKGRILDKSTQVPLEAATVYFTSVIDSAVIDYTISDKKGFFKMDIKKITKPVFLKISSLGYQTFKQEIAAISESKDFGILHMSENPNTLLEVVVKSEAPPIRIRKDTLEFNASSFKVRSDANVETLLKELPGVVVASDGKVTVNGKEVNQILVNGKPFFDADGKIALKELPAEIINKVQVSVFKTEKEKLSGEPASSNNATINLTIDNNKNKGFFGKIMGGYGTQDRYETSGLMNYFKDKRRISVLASSNNINSTGFSMDEVFDNMGGGRNVSDAFYSNSGFGNGGITRSDLLGLNYTEQLTKKFDTNGSYSYNNKNTENENRSKNTQLLPEGNFTTESKGSSSSETLGHDFHLKFEYKIDSTSTIVINPNYSKSNKQNRSNSFSMTKKENLQLLNDITSQDFRVNDTGKFNTSISYNKSFKRKGRFLSLSFDNDNSKEEINGLNQSKTVFYNGAVADDNRNQNTINKKLRDNYNTTIEYAEPIKDSIKFKIGFDLIMQKATEDLNTFDFDPLSQSYSDVNEVQSNDLTSSTKTLRPKAGFSIEKSKFNLTVISGTSITQFDNRSLYLGNVTNLDKNYVLPYANIQSSYRFGDSKSLNLNYNYDVDFPQASQILPVKNLSNSLYTWIGNPDLNPNKRHNGNLSFYNYIQESHASYNFNLGVNFSDSQVISSTVFDENRKAETTFKNVTGPYYANFYGGWQKRISREVHSFTFAINLNGSYSFSKQFTNGNLFAWKTYRIEPKTELTYEYGKSFVVKPSYSFTFNDSKSSNMAISSPSNVLHKFNIQTTNYGFKSWVWGNDFGYNYNSNIADGFKKDFYLWNTSLSYSFFHNKMIAKVKVYDILNQNQGTFRYIRANSIYDMENTVLKRYMMFSLSYKIKKFAGRESRSSEDRSNGVMVF